MSRAVLVLNTQSARQQAQSWVERAPVGTRVEFKGARRTLSQNDTMYGYLTAIANQAEYEGRKRKVEVWKLLFMAQLGMEVEYLPSLDGSTLVAIGKSSSDLSKKEMSDLITLIEAWAAENGVVLHDGAEVAA